ncbi:hypothetical protein ACEUZ9_000857 [Paracoccus litorisediminis]|uniref:hypothetical protein n=1 Tax=Paracoccus litorisediminis TaxID=2006130 RepID=UPI003732BD1D
MNDQNAVEPVIAHLSRVEIAARINWLARQGMKRRDIEADVRSRLTELTSGHPHMGRVITPLIRSGFHHAAPLDANDAARRAARAEDARLAQARASWQGATRTGQRRSWLQHMADHGGLPVGVSGRPDYKDGPDKLVADGYARPVRRSSGPNTSYTMLLITREGMDYLDRLNAKAERRQRKYASNDLPDIGF